jgi:hypothetical protein
MATRHQIRTMLPVDVSLTLGRQRSDAVHCVTSSVKEGMMRWLSNYFIQIASISCTRLACVSLGIQSK